MSSQPKTFGRCIPNEGYKVEYIRRINRISKEMEKEVRKEVVQFYRARIAIDAPLTLRGLFKKLRAKWYKLYNDAATLIAKWLARVVGKRTQADISEQMEKAGFAITKHYTQPEQDVVREIVITQVKLIKSIPQQYMRKTQSLVQKAWLDGRDLKFLTDELAKLNGGNRRRAELIAKDQMNKVTHRFAEREALAYGATKAKWIHVPGEFSSRITHIHMNGETFEIGVGIYDTAKNVEKFVVPAELPFCQCEQEFIFPGME